MKSLRVAVLCREIASGRVALNIINTVLRWLAVTPSYVPKPHRKQFDTLVATQLLTYLIHKTGDTQTGLLLCSTAVFAAEMYTTEELEELYTFIRKL